jgi:hypothetical protein
LSNVALGIAGARDNHAAVINHPAHPLLGERTLTAEQCRQTLGGDHSRQDVDDTPVTDDRHVNRKRQLFAKITAAVQVADERFTCGDDLREAVTFDDRRHYRTERFGDIGDRRAGGLMHHHVVPGQLGLFDAPDLLTERIEIAGSQRL